MKVTCQACSAQYTIADEKVKGRKVKIRCKACQTPIVVDGQNPPAEAARSGNSEQPPALDPFAPETAMAGDADVWNVNLSDTDSRTMTTAEVIEGFRTGLVTNDAFVWRDGMADWIPIMECVEIAPLLSGPTEPPVPVAGQTPLAPAVAPAASATSKLGGVPNLGGGNAGGGVSAARTTAAKAQSGADLFGNLDLAGSEDVDVSVGRSLPVLPGSTAYDDKPTGQRNENSVLFSLDAMKAGFSPSSEKASKASKTGAPRPTQPSNPDDPFGMAGATASAAGNPIFSLNANQALVTAPAPPEPKPVPAAPVYAPGSLPPGAMDEKTKQLVMFGGIGAGAIILLLLSILIFGGSKSSDAESAKAALSAQAEKDAKDKEDSKKEASKAEEKQDDKKDEAAGEKTAASDEKKPEEPTKTEPAKSESTKSEATKSTSHATGAVATKKEEPPPAAGPSTAPPFSKASAISALGAASSSAGSCKKGGGPTGVGKVQVTFAPSGKVTSATVMGPPFAGTAVGGCVANAFRRAKVPAFSGNAVTVSKSFAIN